MTFTALPFLIFFLVFLPLFAVSRGIVRTWLLFLASCVFYGWWNWRFLCLISISIVTDYTVSLALAKYQDAFIRKVLLGVSVAINLGVLVFFKYFNFFLESAKAVLAAVHVDIQLPVLNIVLPIGISFYTFMSMSYTLDVYRGQIAPERSLLRFATFLIFFPHLVAGPVVRASHLIPQLYQDEGLRWDNCLKGLQLVVWGYFMKCGIADSLSHVVDHHFAAPTQFSSWSLTLAVFMYAFQIYGDFAGYSLIAIGIAEMLGFDLGRNFDRPYFSSSFSEFWKRWHISLSTWLRDYLYIPLGGNRNGEGKTYRNLMLTMLLGGLWHGASWNFIIWGGLHGFFLVGQRLATPLYDRIVTPFVPQWILRPVMICVVFLLTCLTWIFFRAQSIDQALYIIRRIVVPDGLGPGSVALKFAVGKGLLLIAILLVCELISFRVPIRQRLLNSTAFTLVSGVICLWVLALFGTFGGDAFIYFQF